MSLRLPTSPLALGFVLLFASALIVPLLSPGVLALGERPYEWNQLISGATHFEVSSAQRVAQSFVPTADYTLLNLTLRLRNRGDTADGVAITIRTDASGRPSTENLAGATLVVGTNLVGQVPVPFPAPPPLARGTRYWIVAESTSSPLNGYEWHHSGTDAYGSGKAMTAGLLGWEDPLSPTDLYFVTYGRETEANVTARIAALAGSVRPGDLVTFRVFVNNTGGRVAGLAWLNDTLLPGFLYIEDTASAAGSSTPFPSYTFADVANGARSFDLVVRVDPSTEPGAVLRKVLSLAFTDSTGALRTAADAEAALLVGIETKSVYLHPDQIGTSRRLHAARPAGGSGSQFNEEIRRDDSPHAYDLEPVLSRDFRALAANAVLYIDSPNHNSRSLDVNLTLSDWDGVTLIPLASVQRRITTNAENDFQAFTFEFPAVDHVVATGGRIRLSIVNRGTSQDDLVLAINSTFAASRIDLRTPTYVRIDRMELRDAAGPATFWSPKDSLVIEANVSDPFGSAEISGARLSVTSPTKDLVVNQTAMALFATDPSTPSAWKLFRFSVSPLSEGTYHAVVTATEANGVQDLAEGSALVRAPFFTLAKTTTSSNVRSGDRYTYDVWFNNTGTGPAGQVWINDSLPAELVFEGSSDPGAKTEDYNWTWTSLEVDNYRLRIDVLVRSGLPPVPYFRNYVFLNYTDEKGFSWPMQVAFVDVAFSGPVIGITQVPSKGVLHSNETIVYDVTLHNTGDPSATIWVNDTLPSGLAHVSNTVSASGGTVTISGNRLYVEFPSLDSMATIAFSITAVAGPNLARGASLTNVASLNYTNSNGFSMPPGIATSSVAVRAPEIRSAALSVTRNQVTPGDIIMAVTTFENTGTEAARDVWVNLTLDWGLLFLNASQVAQVNGNRVHIVRANVPVATTTFFLNASIRSNVTDHQLMTVGGSITYTDGYRNVIGTLSIDMGRVEASVPKMLLVVSPTEVTVEAGTRVFFNVHQSNAGSGVARDVWLILHLPASFSDAVDATNASGATPSVIGSTYIWHWSNVAPGPKAIPLELKAKPSVLNGTRANLTFRTDYTDANGNFVNGETRSVFADFVAARLNLWVAPGVEARAGDAITMVVTLRNIGGAASQTIWVTYANDDSSFEILTYSPDIGAERLPWGLNWSLTEIQPERELTVTLVLRLQEAIRPGASFYLSFNARYTNSADVEVGNAQATSKVTVIADPMPLVWTGIAGSGLGVLGLLAVVRRLGTKIEEVFLVYRDGVLLYHLSRSLSADKDEDVLSGMLTAVQEFIRDAFVYGEHRELHQLDFGDYRIMIERGRNLYLAVVYSGKGASSIRKRVRSVLDHIETTYGSVLAKWDGDMDKVVGARDLIRERLLKSNRRTLRGMPGLP